MINNLSYLGRLGGGKTGGGGGGKTGGGGGGKTGT